MKFLKERRLGKSNNHTKRLNRRIVLDLIRKGEALSRVDLMKATELSAQSISNIIAELEAARLISPAGKTYGGKGQPPANYRINPDVGFGIGLHIDEGYLCGTVLDFSYALRTKVHQELVKGGPAQVLRQLADLSAKLIATAGVQKSRIWGIGLASPRLLDERLQDMQRLEHIRWVELGNAGLDGKLADAMGVPVLVENDANAGALGELTFGAGRGLRHFSYLFLARGLGCGLVQHGAIYRGAWGNAGEAGRFPIDSGGKAIHLEQLLSVSGLLARVNRKSDASRSLPSLMSVAASPAAAAAVDAWCKEAGGQLRWLVALLENFNDPETIVIGSYMPEDILRRLVATAAPLIHSISARQNRQAPRLQVGRLQQDVVSLGAATMPLLATTEADPLGTWLIAGRIKDVYRG